MNKQALKFVVFWMVLGVSAVTGNLSSRAGVGTTIFVPGDHQTIGQALRKKLKAHSLLTWGLIVVIRLNICNSAWAKKEMAKPELWRRRAGMRSALFIS